MTDQSPNPVKHRLPRAGRKRSHRYVESSSFLSMVGRVVMAAGRRVGEADADDLAQLIEIRRTLDLAIVEAVRGLRSSGATWQEIGDVTGISRQAALMFYGPRLEGGDQQPA